MTKEEFRKILDICSREKVVREAVIKNHDDNLWWPLYIKDYRKRLLVAGLSTRISYSMIDSYRNVIKILDEYTYEEIKNMNECEVKNIIKSLGLFNTRYKYILFMINFIDKYEDELQNLSNDELINLIAKNVNGASYKVAQCCVLYMKGYYSGIMPVDSGMKDMELPCMGFNEYKNAIGHDLLRKELEELTRDNDLESIIKNNGYEYLNISDYKNATWWAHLVLIYYKRNICNKHNPSICPLKNSFELKHKCIR